MDIIDSVVECIKKWKSESESTILLDEIYLFGSTIYKDGIQFQPAISDLDLIAIIPDAIDSAVKRKNWIAELKRKKARLESEMVILLGKKFTDKEIISLIPVTRTELKHDIHKSGARNFFRINEFLNINSGEITHGRDLWDYENIDNELATQVFEAVQKKRNLFLKNSATKDELVLELEMNSDVLPKELARESAKVRAIREGIKSAGDQLNTSYGKDFLQTFLLGESAKNPEYEALYLWIDARSGGRSRVSDKNKLAEMDHLLMYEILYDLVKAELSKLIKQKIESEKNDQEILAQLSINSSFADFLEGSELLSKAHSQKQSVQLTDIFIYPDLSSYDGDREYATIENSEDVGKDFLLHQRIVIAGDNQSGKSSLCKQYFKILFSSGLIPVYLCDKSNNYLGNILNRIESNFAQQYDGDVEFKNVRKELIVPIVDDFHFAKRKDKVINDLSIFQNQILVVDDIFGLNFKDENIIQSYTQFTIREFNATLRNKLIKQWLSLNTTFNGLKPDQNGDFAELDKMTAMVEGALGKVFGSGIVPAYPFFILSLISAFETFKPLDQEITSQGYCYQALLYMYLKKQGVKNEDIDTYINFLTELSYFVYENPDTEIDSLKFDYFIKEKYLPNYHLPIPLESILSNLFATNIFGKNSLGNYEFFYQYLYYFFVGKYFAEHIDDKQAEIQKILLNLHKNDNAYISVFISHHSKKSFMLDEIVKIASDLFSKFEPATLSIDELEFFDNKAEMLIKAVLPDPQSSPEKAREQLLQKQDEIERQKHDLKKQKKQNEEIEDELLKEMRRSVKTVEVMGTIIKNRAGSILKPKLEAVFEEGMKVHLRIVSSFISLIRDEKSQLEIEEFLTKMLAKVITERGITPSQERLASLSKTIFWNNNFSIVYSFINKIVHSLGSDKLTDMIATVCDRQNTPASFIVKHGILMWYDKTLQVDTISGKIESDGFSKTGTQIINHMIVKHCRLHSVGYKSLQKIENQMGIPSKVIFKARAKK